MLRRFQLTKHVAEECVIFGQYKISIKTHHSEKKAYSFVLVIKIFFILKAT